MKRLLIIASLACISLLFTLQICSGQGYPINSLAGSWRVIQIFDNGQEAQINASAQVSVSGNVIYLEWWWYNGSGMQLNGGLNGLSLQGGGTMTACCPPSGMNARFQGQLSPDGRSIDLNINYATIRDRYRLLR